MSDSVSSLKKQLEKYKKNFDASELRVVELEKVNFDIAQARDTLVKEVAELKKENDNLNKDLTKALGSADVTLVQRNARLELDIQKAVLDKQDLAKQITVLENDNLKFQNDNKILLEKNETLNSNLIKVQNTIGTSYSAEDLSNYLSKTIEDFNKNSSTEDVYAKYVISSMDIDLKAQVFHDEKNNLRFSAPNLEKTTENSLSSIKISIRAIPK